LPVGVERRSKRCERATLAGPDAREPKADRVDV